MRPEVLFPLFTPLTSLRGVGPKSAQLLKKIGISCPRDVVFHLPATGIDRRISENLSPQMLPGVVTALVQVTGHTEPRRKGGVHRVHLMVGNVPAQITYFRPIGRSFIAQHRAGGRFLISGRAELFDGVFTWAHPDYLVAEDKAAAVPRFEPVYGATAGLGQKTLRSVAQNAVSTVPDLSEWIDPNLLRSRDWPSWKKAVQMAHTPTSLADLAADNTARERLAYDEVFAHQLTLVLARQKSRSRPGRATCGDGRLRSAALAHLSFALTGAQDRCVDEITRDMGSDRRMMRLLQGDVGAGKTLVAVMSMLAVTETGGQAVLMAPTEILARQHAQSINKILAPLGVDVGILTSRDKGSVRTEILHRLQSGDLKILVGTHAVFQDAVAFADLRLAVVDEQHRFGVEERMRLAAKGEAVDMLLMTATPIPRSLAMTQYGDMDVSILDEKPPGRRPVQTAVISLDRMEQVIERLRAALAAGQQAYWVCPLVSESELTDLAAAQARFEHLRSVLGEDAVVLVHGQMPAPEKDAAMRRFQDGRSGVLVATTVIEVGVDVPNATIMVVERAENFGLSQLHQLRGRVGRGAKASSCVLLYQSPLSASGQRRLGTLRESDDGFHLAEVDLKMRGAGDVLGHAQSGLPRFQIADLERDGDVLALARSDAKTLLAQDPKLETARGRAAVVLLWLMQHERSAQVIATG